MSHTIHSYAQGSEQWHAHRAAHYNASEAPAVMGASKFTPRAELVREKATGIQREHDAAAQRRFAAGHAAEIPVRAKVEQITGTEFFPVTASVVVDGLPLSASYDGLSMDESQALEIKLWNEGLAAQVRAGELEPHYYWQLEQQLLVVGAESVIFATGDEENLAHMEYRAVPGRREALIAAWKQFREDVAAYTQPAASAAEKVVAEPVEALPAVSVTVTGTLALADNFDAFERALRTFLADRLIREPQTDQDFADLGLQIKAMKKAEDALDAAESQMLAQVETVDQAKRRKDTLKKLVRDNRLMAEKLLASEKERRKGELVAEGVTALRAHVAKLNERLGDSLMPATATAADFGGAIKGLSSLDSMRDKIGVLLAQAKIAASDVADKIEANVKALAAVAPEHAALFTDRSAIVLKAPEDCATLIRARVAEHDAAVKRRAEEAAERERERIRREEAARVEREAQERAAAERRQQEAAAAAERAAQAAAVPPAPAPTYPPAAPSQVYATGPVNVVPMPTKAPAATATLIKLGAINERIAPLSIDAAGLAALGFQPATTQGAAKMYAERDLPRMLAAMLQHIGAVQAKLAA